MSDTTAVFGAPGSATAATELMRIRLGQPSDFIHSRRMRVLSIIASSVMIASCGSQPIEGKDAAYFGWDERRVLCAVSLEDQFNDVDSITSGLVRARDQQEVLLLYGHKPGRDFSVDKVVEIASIAQDMGVPTLTFQQLAAGGSGAGVAMSFDDRFIDEWYEMSLQLDAASAKATFFVTRFHTLSDARIEMLRAMESAGHGIEYHSTDHLNAVDYVEEHGVAAYIEEEFLPDWQKMRDEGFAPTSFAYPYGHRTDEIDAALLEHVELLRSLSFTHAQAITTDPCPR